MEQKVFQLINSFQEFQSAYDQASSEDKIRLAVQVSKWAQEQVNFLGILTPNHPAGGLTENHEDTVSLKDSAPRDMQHLVENEIHLRQMTEHLEQVVWVRDLHTGQILYVSPAYEMVWGRSCESLTANPDAFIESVHPEDRLQLMVSRPHDDRKLTTQEYRIIRPDGSLRWIFARSFLIHEAGEPAYLLVSFAQDITDQKQLELTLRTALDRTREQVNLSRKMSLARKPEAVLRTLMSARELRSAQLADLLFFEYPKFGPTRGLELVASWQSSESLSAFPDESSLYEEHALLELLQHDRPVIFTDIRTDPRLATDVREILLQGKIHCLAIFPMVASGVWLGCLLIFYNQEYHFDTIELRHLKVLVNQAAITLYNLRLLAVEEDLRGEAERANQIKSQFLAMISHELRTPLTSIIGFTTTLLAEDVVWEPSEQRDFVQTIQKEAGRLQELINHLLDLSRLEVGILPISLEHHSILDIIKETLPQLLFLTQGQKILTHLPANLPPVHVDAKRITQVLINLVQNASVYAPEGTEITISASLRGNFIQVNVTDQGPGIPPDERKRVFEAFRRGAHEENGPGKGAGLGLAICKGLIEAQGGRIWIRKKNTPGATISFTLPIAPSPV